LKSASKSILKTFTDKKLRGQIGEQWIAATWFHGFCGIWGFVFIGRWNHQTSQANDSTDTTCLKLRKLKSANTGIKIAQFTFPDIRLSEASRKHGMGLAGIG
jgi:ammonia channel protein AmtB